MSYPTFFLRNFLNLFLSSSWVVLYQLNFNFSYIFPFSPLFCPFSPLFFHIFRFFSSPVFLCVHSVVRCMSLFVLASAGLIKVLYSAQLRHGYRPQAGAGHRQWLQPADEGFSHQRPAECHGAGPYPDLSSGMMTVRITCTSSIKSFFYCWVRSLFPLNKV